jgi:ribosomal-protein-alanine N-acetyltransferase
MDAVFEQMATTVQIRWLIRRDMPETLQIEKESFEYPWTEEDFLCCLRQKNCIGMVAVHHEKVVGFMIYELHKARLTLLNFAVHPNMRRRRVGAQMIQRLKEKLSAQRRREIIVEIRETNLQALNFFKSRGFVALGLVKDRYDDTDEDGVLMRYLLNAPAEAGKNRISGYYPDDLADAA